MKAKSHEVKGFKICFGRLVELSLLASYFYPYFTVTINFLLAHYLYIVYTTFSRIECLIDRSLKMVDDVVVLWSESDNQVSGPTQECDSPPSLLFSIAKGLKISPVAEHGSGATRGAWWGCWVHLSGGAIVAACPKVHTSLERLLTPTPRRLEVRGAGRQ